MKSPYHHSIWIHQYTISRSLQGVFTNLLMLPNEMMNSVVDTKFKVIIFGQGFCTGNCPVLPLLLVFLFLIVVFSKSGILYVACWNAINCFIWLSGLTIQSFQNFLEFFDIVRSNYSEVTDCRLLTMVWLCRYRPLVWTEIVFPKWYLVLVSLVLANVATTW